MRDLTSFQALPLRSISSVPKTSIPDALRTELSLALWVAWQVASVVAFRTETYSAADDVLKWLDASTISCKPIYRTRMGCRAESNTQTDPLL